MYKRKVLDNGLRVITHPMSGMQSAALGIWLKVGGRYEPDQSKGIAHYLEHLLFKGSKKYSCRKIKELIEGVGGSLNGFTSEELTCYLVKMPAQYLDLALDILSDMVLNPLLPEEEIEKERTVILEEMKMYKDLPQSYKYELLDELLWPDQPLGKPIIGSFESVNSIKRGSLFDFSRQYYTPANMVISAAGRINYNKLLTKIEGIFSRFKEKNINTFSKVKEEQDEPQLKLFYKDTEQSHLALGFHGYSRGHPLRYAIGLLNIILGANMSSRLFEELRENKGLAYEIGSHVKYFHDTGSFIVHAGIDNQKVQESIRLILEELKKIKTELVTTSEFKRAKEFFIGQLMLALEDTLDHMLWIGEATTCLDQVYSLKEVIEEISSIKRQDLKKVAGEIFKNEKLNASLIGPLKAEEEIYKQLDI